MNRSCSFRGFVPTYCLFVLLVLILSIASTIAAAAGKSSQQRSPLVTSNEAGTEIQLRMPVRHAIVLNLHSKVRTLYGRNDILFDPLNPMRSFTFLTVHPETVILRDNHSGRTWSRRIGSSLPDLPRHILATTVMLDRLHYRYRVVEQLTQTEPVLVSLKGSLAVLEKEVAAKTSVPAQTTPSAEKSIPRAQNFRSPNPTLSRLTRVKKLDDNTYEMSAADLMPTLKNAGQVFSDLKLMISPTLSIQGGIGFNIRSEVADGILNHQGFTVTNSKLAQVFGIQAGDTILNINNRPVTDPRSAWWAYQEFIIRNPHKTEMRVGILRGDSLLTKTYRVK